MYHLSHKSERIGRLRAAASRNAQDSVTAIMGLGT